VLIHSKPVKVLWQLNLINANGKRQKRKKKGHGPELDGY